MADNSASRITLEVFRSEKGRLSRFDVPVPAPASRVLDALLYVREHLDPSLGFRYSCRAGMCGSCALVVNGKEALACQSAIGALGTTTVRLSPLRALPVLHDLMCDMTPFFDTLKRADAAMRPKEPNRKTLRVMPPGEPHRALIEGQNGCLTCGACFSACEWSATRPGYLGPAAMNRVLMLSLDERDARGKSRLATVANESGALRCHGLGNCSQVCPVDIPLREGMQKLKGLLAMEDIS
ncbi:MAG TPA: 2Fe-2S iron-sulfur cluster-binding protein [Usitatibacter sp.]|nr:2Fe-2S iron-sulfur cluster-binding protein [Usitatibacter sp.]